MNYYNEIDPYAAQWLRNLIAGGHIPKGYVDERTIEVIKPSDLTGYTQCHFFAGIGGWPLALRLAGWPDDRQVWTGSCPCQPFSSAGKNAGFDDERHLWPAFQWLIQECQPPIVFGEQVASSAVGSWVDLVHADMEALGYAFGCAAFPAAGVGAPHIRDRMYWVGDGLADPGGERRDGFDPLLQRKEQGHSVEVAGRSPVNGFWGNAEWCCCRDDRYRAIEPGTFPLANGVPNRVGRLRAYGNAIVPQAAAEFIRSASREL